VVSNRRSLTIKKFLDRQSHVACDLAEQRRRYVTAWVEWDGRASAIGMSILTMRASLACLHKPEPFEKPGHFTRLQNGN
jgi:hypothetical protein